jgi:hypothetical protein
MEYSGSARKTKDSVSFQKQKRLARFFRASRGFRNALMGTSVKQPLARA